MQYFKNRIALIRKCHGTARAFAAMETICFPVSTIVVLLVVVQAILTLVYPPLARMFELPCFSFNFSDWFSCILVSAAIGYLTNYIAIQMLYYPVTGNDVGFDEVSNKSKTVAPATVRLALKKSSIIRFVTFGFWKAGLLPRNRKKVAAQIGLIAEERFMTAEAIAQMLPPIINALISKDCNGQVRLVGFIREVVCDNSESVASFIRKTLVGYIRSSDRNGLHRVLGEIGRSEAVANALTSAVIKYVEENPDDGVAFVRSIVSQFSQNLYARESNAEPSLLGGFKQLARSIAGAAIEEAAEIGYPQVHHFFERIGEDPNVKAKLKERMAHILPQIADGLSDSIIRNPELLERVVSGASLTRIIKTRIDDEGFWLDVGENISPCLENALTSALQGISKNGFFSFFKGRHIIAENVESTILRMNLLDFYKMLDDVMAEHLGAIQVFGFVLGGVIGYVQYAVLFALKGCVGAAYLMMGIPLVLVVLVKIVISIRRVNAKAINA